MCLYNFFPCPAHRPDDLHQDLKSPTPDIVKAGVVRCVWYDAVANHGLHPLLAADPDTPKPQSGVRFLDGKEICPYLVIRHDNDVFDMDLYGISEAVLMGGLSSEERGCQKCWKTVLSRGWVGRCPSEAEKMDYLYTTNQAGASACSGSGITKGESNGIKRKRADERHVKAGTATDDLSITAARTLKKSKYASPKTSSWFREGSASSFGSFNPALSPVSSPSAFDRSTSPELQNPARNAKQPVLIDAALFKACEVIPPRPDQVNKSKSEDYVVVPDSKFMNWNQGHDNLFSNASQNVKSKPKRKSTSFSPTPGDNSLRLSITPRVSLARSAGDVDSASAQRSNCEECHKRTFWPENAPGPILCLGCSLTVSSTSTTSQQIPAPQVEVEGLSTTTSDESEVNLSSAQSEVAVASVSNNVESEFKRDPIHDASDASSEVSPSDSETLSQGTVASPPKPHVKPDETDRPNEVARLRREVVQLRNRLVTALERDAKAARREAKLLKRLNQYEGEVEVEVNSGEKRGNGE